MPKRWLLGKSADLKRGNGSDPSEPVVFKVTIIFHKFGNIAETEHQPRKING